MYSKLYLSFNCFCMESTWFYGLTNDAFRFLFIFLDIRSHWGCHSLPRWWMHREFPVPWCIPLVTATWSAGCLQLGEHVSPWFSKDNLFSFFFKFNISYLWHLLSTLLLVLHELFMTDFQLISKFFTLEMNWLTITNPHPSLLHSMSCGCLHYAWKVNAIHTISCRK